MKKKNNFRVRSPKAKCKQQRMENIASRSKEIWVKR